MVTALAVTDATSLSETQKSYILPICEYPSLFNQATGGWERANVLADNGKVVTTTANS